MTHTYTLTGMTCAGCEAKVNSLLSAVPGITAVSVSKESHTATLSMDQPISLSTLQTALGGQDSKYQIAQPTTKIENTEEPAASWFQTYKPILLIFSYITLLSSLLSIHEGAIHWMSFMSVFMGAFFLTFSFFKMLDLKGFAESYAMYDLVAEKLKIWGYLYAFTELALGLAYVTNFMPVLTNWVTLVVMTISIMGVLRSVLNKQKIKCACLGAVFNLPMSTVTILEDALMIAMSACMLFIL
jgi:copper chaperone CopZ